jgi:hypothetical protein
MRRLVATALDPDGNGFGGHGGDENQMDDHFAFSITVPSISSTVSAPINNARHQVVASQGEDRARGTQGC